MSKRVVNNDQIKHILNRYENIVIVPELLAEKYGYDLYDVFTIIFNYRMAFKNYTEMTEQEISALLTKKVRTINDARCR